VGVRPIWIDARTGTFGPMLEKMCSHNVHRVYAAERHGCHIHAHAVITATDVLHTVLSG